MAPGAGQYGEGAKVEINRLIGEGCTVKYWTGNAAWTFDRRPTPGCSIPELHVTVQPGGNVYDFVSIAIIAEPGYRGNLLETDNFLFLQGSYSKLASQMRPDMKLSGMELLLDQPHWGKVFIHGIFVTKAPFYKLFGLNYTGESAVLSFCCMQIACRCPGHVHTLHLCQADCSFLCRLLT